MRYLLILLFLFGCGADPDDFQPEESDGCRSDDIECQEALETDTEADTEAEENETSTDTTAEDQKGAHQKDAEGEEERGSIVINNEVNVIIGPQGERIDKDHADNCLAGRICRGVHKAEVLDLIGEPETIEKDDPFEIWEWIYSFDDPVHICGNFYKCTVTFRDGQVVDQKDIKAQWLDLENF